jgi:hypothetical protein
MTYFVKKRLELSSSFWKTQKGLTPNRWISLKNNSNLQGLVMWLTFSYCNSSAYLQSQASKLLKFIMYHSLNERTKPRLFCSKNGIVKIVKQSRLKQVVVSPAPQQTMVV